MLELQRQIERLAELRNMWGMLRLDYQDMWDQKLWKDQDSLERLHEPIRSKVQKAVQFEINLPRKTKLLRKIYTAVSQRKR